MSRTCIVNIPLHYCHRIACTTSYIHIYTSFVYTINILRHLSIINAFQNLIIAQHSSTLLYCAMFGPYIMLIPLPSFPNTNYPNQILGLVLLLCVYCCCCCSVTFFTSTSTANCSAICQGRMLIFSPK